MSKRPPCEMTVEFMKLLRSGWHSQLQIQTELGWGEMTVARWVREMSANGMIISRIGERRSDTPGYAPKVYSLSQDWGGTASKTERAGTPPPHLDIFHLPGVMPDADTDVLVWDASSPEAQLGAYVGEESDGPVWIDAQGALISDVVAWADMPRWRERTAPNLHCNRRP